MESFEIKLQVSRPNENKMKLKLIQNKISFEVEPFSDKYTLFLIPIQESEADEITKILSRIIVENER